MVSLFSISAVFLYTKFSSPQVLTLSTKSVYSLLYRKDLGSVDLLMHGLWYVALSNAHE